MIIKIFGSEGEGYKSVAKIIQSTLSGHGITVKITSTDCLPSLEQSLNNIETISKSDELIGDLRVIKLKKESGFSYSDDISE